MHGRVIALSVFDLMTLNIVLRVMLGSGIIFFTKFDLRQLIRAWILAFFDVDALCHAAVTLISDPLTLTVRGTSSIMWSKSVYEIWAKWSNPGWINWELSHSVTLTFDLDLVLLQNFGCHV